MLGNAPSGHPLLFLYTTVFKEVVEGLVKESVKYAILHIIKSLV